MLLWADFCSPQVVHSAVDIVAQFFPGSNILTLLDPIGRSGWWRWGSAQVCDPWSSHPAEGSATHEIGACLKLQAKLLLAFLKNKFPAWSKLLQKHGCRFAPGRIQWKSKMLHWFRGPGNKGGLGVWVGLWARFRVPVSDTSPTGEI